jgi:hypothetical protein
MRLALKDEYIFVQQLYRKATDEKPVKADTALLQSSLSKSILIQITCLRGSENIQVKFWRVLCAALSLLTIKTRLFAIYANNSSALRKIYSKTFHIPTLSGQKTN